MKAKICFFVSLLLISISVYFFSTRPAMILYLFTLVFIFMMVVRVIVYWRTNLILFMLDLCYFINLTSLVFVWFLPQSQLMQAVQFGLANSQAYSGVFVFRNSLVFHDLQRLTSTFIHILPCMFSYLVRWHPRSTSIWWHTEFLDSGATADPLLWHTDVKLFWQCLIPALIYVTRDLLYFTVIHGCIKPDAKYMDSFRYVVKKKLLNRYLWKRFHPRWHVPMYITLGLLLVVGLLLISIVAWSNYAFHSFMIAFQLAVVVWNAACYYIDCYQPLWLTVGQLDIGDTINNKGSAPVLSGTNTCGTRLFAESRTLLDLTDATVASCVGNGHIQETVLCLNPDTVLQILPRHSTTISDDNSLPV